MYLTLCIFPFLFIIFLSFDANKNYSIMLFEFRSKYFNAYIVLSLLIILISISFINLPFGFDDLLSQLPGYYHNEDTGKNIVIIQTIFDKLNFSNFGFLLE